MAIATLTDIQVVELTVDTSDSTTAKSDEVEDFRLVLYPLSSQYQENEM